MSEITKRAARIIGVSYNSDGCGTIGGDGEKVKLVSDIASLEKDRERLDALLAARWCEYENKNGNVYLVTNRFDIDVSIMDP